MANVAAFPDPDSAVVKALGDFCAAYLKTDESAPIVIRGYMNRVSKPAGPDYILITPMNMTRLATNRHDWRGQDGATSITQPTQRRVQIDCYGEYAAVWAKTLTTLLRDLLACEFLAPYDIAPLFVEDAQDLTALEGDEQIHPRYMLGLMIQCNETVTINLDYFDNVNLILKPQA